MELWYTSKMYLIGIIFITLFLHICGGTDEVHRCPRTEKNSRFYMTTFRDTCYMFVNIEKHWDEARSHCWRAGGEMLLIKDGETMNFVKKVLNSNELGWSKNGVWNGANDLRETGWEWTTGEKLRNTYQYWAPNQPSSFLGMSLENCCCMRRSDDWRWHDYHCHVDGFTYYFVCQFAMMNITPTKPGEQQGGAPLTVERDEKVAIIVLLVTSVLLLIFIAVVVYFLYRKHERQKQRHPSIHYQPRGYATVMQDVSLESRDSRDHNGSTRPVSNIYLEPDAINNYPPPDYEQIAKETITNVPKPTGQSEDMVPLMYVGGAASADNLSGSPSDASGATSGYCSANTMERRNNENDEYVEMSGDFVLAKGSAKIVKPSTSANGSAKIVKPSTSANGSAKTVKPSTSGDGNEDYMNSNCSSGATGSTQDLKSKSTNIYASPMTISDYILENGDSILKKTPKQDAPEVHIYTNKLDGVMDNAQRPLPPVPVNEKNFA